MTTSVFFSYSHADESYRDELEKHLAVLKRQGIIDTWHDRRIAAGDDLHGKIDQELERANVVLLLVTSNFLASDYCYDVELARALQRHRAGEAKVIPVIVHPCDWKNSPLGFLRATPQDGRPISKFPNVHDGYHQVVEDLRNALDDFSDDRGPKISRPNLSPAEPDLSSERRVRSSNLRVRHDFTDFERDQFIEESFEYISNFFENSLRELANRNKGLAGNFRRIDGNQFSAGVYRNGKKQTSCSIWLGAEWGGKGIYYGAEQSIAGSRSFNESLSVTDDGTRLSLKPLGMSTALGGSREDLSQQGAAEHLWALFIQPLQQ